MNDEEFKRKLSEVAEWHLPVVKPDGVERRRIKNELMSQDGISDQPSINFKIYEKINQTGIPEITKIHNTAINCDDCGRHCPTGRKKESKLYVTHGKSHWRQKCLTCKLSFNPKTGKFDLNHSAASLEWHNSLKRELKVQKKLAKSQIKNYESNGFQIEENDTEIIKKYTG